MPDRKHIVILGSAYPLRGGGLATFNERLAREFQAAGHQVTIFTFSLQYPSFLFPGKSQYSTENPPTDLDIRVVVNSINPFNWIQVGNFLKKMNPDFIVVRYWIPFMAPCLSTICRIAKKNKTTKIICIADNILPHEKRPGDRLLTKFFLPVADAFITMSDQVTKDLAQFKTNKKYIQIHHPLYDNFGTPIETAIARKKLGIAADQKILLFFGFIRKYKGLDLLIEAMTASIVKKENIKLLVAGEFYQDKQPYLEQIKRYGLQNDIILYDHFVPDNEVASICCTADFIVQPYRHATQSGVTPLAYHFDIPMIVTRVGGLPDMVLDDKTGLIAEPNAESIAAHIAKAFANGSDYYKPSLREFKKNFSWSHFSKELLNLYNEL
ncbi:MAG: glycosyltransferase family 4 protein [Chitinophagaceae bacterium]